MKMALLLLGVPALVMSACAAELSYQRPPAPAAAVGGTVVLTGARGFAAAELAYITAADAAGRLADAGLIRGPAASRLRAINGEARQALVAGKSAIGAVDQARAAAALFGFADRLRAFTGEK